MGRCRRKLCPRKLSRRNLKFVPHPNAPTRGELTHNTVPISVFIIGGALSFALSTRVRGICSFAVKFLFHPFEDPDPEGPRDQPRKVRRYRHARKRDEYALDNDFWQEHRDRHDVEYVVPMHNRWKDKERGKGGAGRRRRALT
jgi:hypothetical protein